MTGRDFDWMVSNHVVWGWKAPVKASVSGVSLLQLSPFFASIFPLFPRNAWYSGYHNWLANYSDSEFHGRWKTVTVSSRSPNLSKHWRFLAFWLSLCFGSFLLFLVCHDTAFLFSTRAMTALGWLPNAHREKCAVRSPYKRYRAHIATVYYISRPPLSQNPPSAPVEVQTRV